MRQLIKDQSIMIDDHRRGQAHAHFDDIYADIHLDKKAKSGKYRIRVPLNTNRPVTIEMNGRRNEVEEVPQHIAREIRDAFEDADKRRPSKYTPEERNAWNWLRHTQKQYGSV